MIKLGAELREQLHLENRSIHCTVHNESRYLLILDQAEHPINTVHGSAQATINKPNKPVFILPWDSNASLLGGKSTGAGVELDFRLGVWSVPELDKIANDARKERIAWVEANVEKRIDDPNHQVYHQWVLRDGAGSEQVSSLYAMLDNPLIGSNKMYAVDVPRNGIAYRPHNFVERSKFTGDYKFEYGPHDLTVTKALTGTFKISKGENNAEATLHLYTK
ncbi:hypothetical protein M422DRAFT_47288 [Sphaerobolus stellatus SS14]|uniref:Uncharacterized protein n=1 Tax=Sphaerobolus stellatus (strain SS14) TaxID=990650 RepID=A0A0C9VZM4_SPHS4|nr:hypothetical protein M422DRAFT_47288 [Sphaerobolus stellatus SS14]